MSLFWQIYRRPIFTVRADVAGHRGMKAFTKKYSRAFTLYELIISIVLFALVASLVITFITYMSAFSEKNSAATQRVREQLALRKEIDFWFSAFDAENYSLSVEPRGDRLLLAEDKDTGTAYPVTREISADWETLFVFRYPTTTVVGAELTVNRVECSHITAVYFTAYPEKPAYTLGEGEKSLRFTVNTLVNPAIYACDIVYT